MLTNSAVDHQEQADCYRAVLQVVNEILATKTYLKGIFWWEGHLIHEGWNYDWVNQDKYGWIWFKPAENVLKHFYRRVIYPVIEISIQSPNDGDIVWGDIDVMASSLNGNISPKSAKLYINGNRVSSINNLPFVFRWNTRNYPNGENVIKIIAYNELNQKTFKEIRVIVDNIYSPINASGCRVVNRSLSQVEFIDYLTWEINPVNRNIITYKIYQLQDNGRQLLNEVSSNYMYYYNRIGIRNSSITYLISAVNSSGREGEVVSITVK